MIEFNEHWVDESHRWTVKRVMGHRILELGTIEYHYGFEQWSFWTMLHGSIIPKDQMQAILEFLDKPKPTQEERDLYFSYKGDPLAR